MNSVCLVRFHFKTTEQNQLRDAVGIFEQILWQQTDTLIPRCVSHGHGLCYTVHKVHKLILTRTIYGIDVIILTGT